MPHVVEPIRAELPVAFHPGWNQIDGLEVDGKMVTIEPTRFFYRLENPKWVVCDWEAVRKELPQLRETVTISLEQKALDFIRNNTRLTRDGAEVLNLAYKVNSHLFRDAITAERGFKIIGARPEHARLLREAATLGALNRVEMTGRITNVCKAWMDPSSLTAVYDLPCAETEAVEEISRSVFLNEKRRAEAVRAAAALGGRLVHGGPSSTEFVASMVAPYGVDTVEFHRELQALDRRWESHLECRGDCS
ncbi:hypothetical protein [Actinomadura sp. NEAU-AAG7]|uniref:hypothetical protein n=1 Tax=Actinomadura sp. NEAU-AAG7 TaxID=2839640 RepID=UPI001BE3FA51|nr:hypothetical protein [Actinomadura sp. NEAU-AAG7]MBT2213450.1 hypothetical protein [Actinomadura sp. NEAU-AAG7]